MKIISNEINIGASSPFEILHISDTHLSFADSRNDQRKIDLAGRRAGCFPQAEEILSHVVSLSVKEKLPVMCTGDLIDFVSYGNLDKVKEYTEGKNFFICAGNHEFSLYVGEAWEDDEYKSRSFNLVQNSYTTNRIDFDSKIINGVNFVALDNSYYLIKASQLHLLKEEVKKGFPVVLMLHVPLFTRELYDYKMGVLGDKDAGLMDVPEELMASYSDYRFRQQRADDVTHEAFEYIAGGHGIKLILTGHIHFDYETTVESSLPQLITGTETVRRILFK